MAIVVGIVGVLTAALGLVGLARPDQLVRFAQSSSQFRGGFYFAIAIRIVLGVVLIAAAPASRFPSALFILGVITLAGAAAVPIIGFERMVRFIEWWIRRPAGFIRAWGSVAVALGMFLVVAVT